MYGGNRYTILSQDSQNSLESLERKLIEWFKLVGLYFNSKKQLAGFVKWE